MGGESAPMQTIVPQTMSHNPLDCRAQRSACRRRHGRDSRLPSNFPLRPLRLRSSLASLSAPRHVRDRTPRGPPARSWPGRRHRHEPPPCSASTPGGDPPCPRRLRTVGDRGLNAGQVYDDIFRAIGGAKRLTREHGHALRQRAPTPSRAWPSHYNSVAHFLRLRKGQMGYHPLR